MKTHGINEFSIVEDYKNGKGFDYICKAYKIGKIRLKEILNKFDVEIRKPSSFSKKRKFVVPDWKTKKYVERNGFHYVARSKDYEFETFDYENNGGYLTSFIKEKYNVEIPSLYERRLYYQETGNYWYEQWFDIIEVKDSERKKCPYCEWSTCDIENKSGSFQMHLKKAHNLTIEEHLKKHIEDYDYFKVHAKKDKLKSILKYKKNYVTCPICGNKYQKIAQSHLLSHNLSMEAFREKYPNCNILSKTMENQTHEAIKLGNTVTPKSRFISKYEKEIQDFLIKNGISFEANRQLLIGKEIDILIKDKKIGIEFDGLKWHTEWFGKKSHNYHLEKTEMCLEKGVGLIHIFEDEYVNNKEIVLHKLSHILGIDKGLKKIMGRKCDIKEIYKYDAEQFLNKYHIQGFVSATVYLGAFFENELIAVMSFKNGNIKNSDWELVRFASNYDYVMQGVGSKMFKYFISKYSPSRIVSFADRRWTLNKDNNFYTKAGFVFENYTRPDYKYYNENEKGMRYKRVHKMNLNKKKLNKKYGFPLTMTETEMAKALGYDRIWDCGLIKYVWENQSDKG